MARYLINHSAEALSLFEEFREREIATESDRLRFAPMSPHWLHDPAQLLGVWAKRL
jgi:hypothetical protein